MSRCVQKRHSGRSAHPRARASFPEGLRRPLLPPGCPRGPREDNAQACVPPSCSTPPAPWCPSNECEGTRKDRQADWTTALGRQGLEKTHPGNSLPFFRLPALVSASERQESLHEARGAGRARPARPAPSGGRWVSPSPSRGSRRRAPGNSPQGGPAERRREREAPTEATEDVATTPPPHTHTHSEGGVYSLYPATPHRPPLLDEILCYKDTDL